MDKPSSIADKPSAKRSPRFPVVEAKKAISLLRGLGKSIAAIRMFPDGGFVVIASGKATPAEAISEENSWDRMFDAQTK
ncbi:hypothetical protein [Roseinatronobacter sp. S2]|uniref:hypothetical protein n=1 Tax=Roseinatronobacter sp. S2 TaxID=3035471 RepID=UPI00240FF54B|nr:hypothetical protein [Roseinatronobacter sp. S2]WFE75657.1 hypothetical protein P8S53_04390 [Roseinatronobacter sp. S2]